MKLGENVERAIRDYGKEAFSNHREEVYSAIKAVCLCGEFLQNQEDWGSRRAICVRHDSTQEDWEKSFWEKYDRRLRCEEIRRLKEKLDSQELGPEENIPLKNFLYYGITLMIAELEFALSGWEEWMELMETQMAANQYRDFRGFQEAVYVLGLFEIIKFQWGRNCHYFKGDFRDAEYLLKVFGSWIPKEEQENYDRYCASFLKELEKKRIDAIKKVLKERDERLEKRQEEKGKIPVLELFRKKMEDIRDDELKELVRKQLEEYEQEDKEEWSHEINLQAAKISNVKKLAELFVYGGSQLKKRLFQYLSEEQQLIVMELWMADFYPPTMEKLAYRLKYMRYAVQGDSLGLLDEECIISDKDLQDSLEKMIGRTVTEKWLFYMI
ncbi:hypothetical protein AALB16_02935 [Lachnospiraceae bacterium 62-35]